MMMIKLKPCACGKIPEYLHITTTSQGRNWASVSGSCCMTWGVDFNTAYQSGDELYELAAEIWNTAPRGHGEKQ